MTDAAYDATCHDSLVDMPRPDAIASRSQVTAGVYEVQKALTIQKAAENARRLCIRRLAEDTYGKIAGQPPTGQGHARRGNCRIRPKIARKGE